MFATLSRFICLATLAALTAGAPLGFKMGGSGALGPMSGSGTVSGSGNPPPFAADAMKAVSTLQTTLASPPSNQAQMAAFVSNVQGQMLGITSQLSSLQGQMSASGSSTPSGSAGMVQGAGELTALVSKLAKTLTTVVAAVPELASDVTSFLTTVEGMLTQLTTAVTTLVTSVLKIVPGLLTSIAA